MRRCRIIGRGGNMWWNGRSDATRRRHDGTHVGGIIASGVVSGEGRTMDDWQQGAPDGVPDGAQVVLVRRGGLGVGAHPDGWCEFWQAQRAARMARAEDRQAGCLGLVLFLFAVANMCGLGVWVARWLGG